MRNIQIHHSDFLGKRGKEGLCVAACLPSCFRIALACAIRNLQSSLLGLCLCIEHGMKTRQHLVSASLEDFIACSSPIGYSLPLALIVSVLANRVLGTFNSFRQIDGV